MVDLDHEFAGATDNLDETWLDDLHLLRIPKRVLFGVRHHLGVGRITTYSDTLFQFDDVGDYAIIVAVGRPEVPHWAEIHDLVAFFPHEPNRWWMRLGVVDLLGRWNIRPWRIPPLTIYETPLRLLQAGADGVVILDWACDPAGVLLDAGPLEVESAWLKARLEGRVQEAALSRFKISLMDLEPADAT